MAVSSNITALILLFVFQLSSAQNFQHFQSISVKEVELVSIDRVGFFYIVLADGSIQKYSEDAELVASFKQEGKNQFISFEAWNGMKLIAYDQKNKTYSQFDRMLKLQKKSSLDEALVIAPYQISVSGVDNLWALDGQVSTLKKINTAAESVEIEILFDAQHSLELNKSNHIKEYQNMLFVNTPKAGIWMYNSIIGKRMKILPIKGINYFNFLGMDLYFVQNNQLHLHDLFTGDTAIIDLPQAAQYVLLTDETMLLVNQEGLHFYRSDLTDK
ncbi:MAG TPA: hypothetical protein PKC24_02700 [Cyclobacteriaceae bacterium]|nr:hypothetical protein [Cyclobacteriaceae bacterium]